MPYDLQNKLVIGVASSAVFNLSDSDRVFREKGEKEYRIYQEQNVNMPLEKGMAFPFIKRIISLNRINNPENPLVEVILLSKNDPDTGLRVMNSINVHELNITRAIFTQGESPFKYIPALNISLFLSGDKEDVEKAIACGLPAGHVMDSKFEDDHNDDGLRIAFDFDGVLAGDESEALMQADGLEKFHAHEMKNAAEPHNPGPLQKFLLAVARIQSEEEKYKKKNPEYKNKLRISIVTARNAPSHERAIKTLKSWNVMVNDAFFLGGIDKSRILSLLKPHIFFDDQPVHLKLTSEVAPSVHIPFGIINAPPEAGSGS